MGLKFEIRFIGFCGYLKLHKPFNAVSLETFGNRLPGFQQSQNSRKAAVVFQACVSSCAATALNIGFGIPGMNLIHKDATLPLA